MNTFRPIAMALGAMAVGAPLVCQAQDPAAEYKNVLALRKANKNEDALKRVDQVLAVYGNPKSRVAKQFMHFTPFFYWQKGEILTKMGQIDKACETFNELYTKEEFRDKALIARSRELPGQAEGYAPYLMAALFQIGNLRYQQAVGAKGTQADPTKFEVAIPLLEEYLKYYESGKATKTEQRMGLDGKVCFLLLQSYLLKAKPDFDKAGQYIEKGKKAKTPLPDDMVMSGLSTVLTVALKNPEYIGWGAKMIDSNAASFHLSADRMGRHAPTLFNSGVKASKMVEAALRSGDTQRALDAVLTTTALFGLVPDSEEIAESIASTLRATGRSAGVADVPAAITYTPADLIKQEQLYRDLVKDHQELDAYIILTQAGMMNQLGSPRLAKAGFKVLIDRYPDLRQKDKDGKATEMRDVNYLQYAQFAGATGDEEAAVAYEQKIDQSKVGEGNKHAVVLKKMQRLVKEGRWEEVVPVADEAMAALAAEKGSLNYVAANFSKVAALYKLGRWDAVLKDGEALLDSGMIKVNPLKEKQVHDYGTQTLFFVVDAAMRLGAATPDMYDKALARAEEFMNKYPSANLEDNPMSPNVYYDAVNILINRRGHGKPEEEQKDLAKALRYCEVIAKNWPEHAIYPTARLLAGNVIISGEDDSKKPEALVCFEDAAAAAIKQGEQGRGIAANALFRLASYAPEYDREGESKDDKAARIRGYFDTFWKNDYEGNPYALQMASLQLSRAVDAKGDAAAYDAALTKAQQIIAREASYSFRNSTQDPELEPTINSYVEAYVTGHKQLHNKTLTLDEKVAHLRSFPGIQKEDKYTNAILQMALINSMVEEQQAQRRAGDTEAVAALDLDIARTFRQMRDQFKPADLTNFICVRLGDYAVDYARRLSGKERGAEAAAALTYYEQVLSNNRDMRAEATLGKANALALSEDDAKRKEAYALYGKLTSLTDPDVVAPALVGLTDLNMSTKNYKAAVESADKFMRVRSSKVTSTLRNDMMMKLAAAYCESGDVQQGIQTYINLYQNQGNISYSAPACKAMMEQYWKRNNPASGDRMKNTFKPSDRWLAWNTGQRYVKVVTDSKLEEKMSPSDRDKFNEVKILLAQYSKDAAVQKEDKENKAFQSKLSK